MYINRKQLINMFRHCRAVTTLFGTVTGSLSIGKIIDIFVILGKLMILLLLKKTYKFKIAYRGNLFLKINVLQLKYFFLYVVLENQPRIKTFFSFTEK